MRRALQFIAQRPAPRPMGRSCACAVIALAICASSLGAHAEAVPLPRPAPRERLQPIQLAAAPLSQAPIAIPVSTTTIRTAAPVAPLQIAANKPQQQAPIPIIPNPRRHAPASIFMSFDANQKAQAARVSAYLTALTSMSGNFVQIGPDGSRTTGEFYIQKPGKVRFEYDEPTTIAMVADGSSLAVRDRKLATQDIYPLSQTPLRYLLADRIDLMRDTNVVAVTADDLYTSVTIEEKNPLVGTSRLMLMVSNKDNQLKQWTITDPQGYDTTVAIYNIDGSKKLDPGLFRIDHTRYPGSN